MYLKNDMKAKFKFLHELEAAVGTDLNCRGSDCRAISGSYDIYVPHIVTQLFICLQVSHHP